MRKVYKFAIPAEDTFTIELPVGAQVLCAQEQGRAPYLWALLDPDAPRATRHFRLAGTGRPIEETALDYVDTFQIMGGGLVFHLFEIKE